MNISRYILLFLLLITVAFTSCRRDLFSKDPSLRLSFSREEVLFDSTFTQIGTSTEVFMVRNKTKQNLLIDQIYLAGGSGSKFRMVVDGEAGNSVKDIEIAAGDSIYVFVEATIDASGSTGSLFEADSVLFSYNGNLDAVSLFAAGNDAIYFYPNDTLNLSNGGKFAYRRICNETWVPGKPYVIIGRAIVDSDCKLTIMPGTKVHFFKNADLWVFQDGTLQSLGEQNNPVLFTGTNQMFATQQIPGQWGGLVFFDGKTDNILRHTKIQNGTIGINMQPLNFYDATSPRKVTLENVIIENMTSLGIYAQNFVLDAVNLRVSNCGQGGVACIFGGDYAFTHCTFANYWPGQGRPNPTLLAGNGFNRNDTLYANDLKLRVYNTVVTGNQLNELVIDSVGGTVFDYLFENSALTLDNKFVTPENRYFDIIKNANPQFNGPFWNDYRLKENSPLLNKGNLQRTQQNLKAWFDLEGKNRLQDGKPDIGALER
ncbi:MAG: hypothetical protein MH137_01630 [Flavobacteriales bacterium]|nr:hypothetical protein [Flavobacteriales bacterium]